MSPDGTSSDANLFRIEPTTGRILTNSILDHESRSQYVFRIKAQDGGTPPRSAVATIEVIIDDQNETPPEFESTHASFSVVENTAPGSVVGSVKARDRDSGENGRISYFITWGNLFGTFGVNRSTGDIFLTGPLDYEESSGYSIRIRAMDNNPVNPMSSIINVNISVIDVNDNPPVFDENPVIITVRENIPTRTHIYTLAAQDMDSGPRGVIRYTLLSQSPPGDWFAVEPDTGFLSINRVIDYEMTPQVSVVVKATDQPGEGEESFFSTVTVLVLIEDVNDNIPEFQTRSEIDIMEDEPVGYPVMHIITTDRDSHDNGRVTYGIVSGNENGNFYLDTDTGRAQSHLYFCSKTLNS